MHSVEALHDILKLVLMCYVFVDLDGALHVVLAQDAPHAKLALAAPQRVPARRARREPAAAALLQVREALVRALRLHNDGAEPSSVDEPRAARSETRADGLGNRYLERFPARRGADRE